MYFYYKYSNRIIQFNNEFMNPYYKYDYNMLESCCTPDD